MPSPEPRDTPDGPTYGENSMLPAWMKRSASRRAEVFEARLDALLADHTSLLQVAARSLELLNEIGGLARQWEAERLESYAAILQRAGIPS